MLFSGIMDLFTSFMLLFKTRPGNPSTVEYTKQTPLVAREFTFSEIITIFRDVLRESGVSHESKIGRAGNGYLIYGRCTIIVVYL